VCVCDCDVDDCGVDDCDVDDCGVIECAIVDDGVSRKDGCGCGWVLTLVVVVWIGVMESLIAVVALTTVAAVLTAASV
jgi:hypothetical protein